MTFLEFLGWWFAASCIGGLAFCWLFKTGRISFAPIEDRNQFTHDWKQS